MNNLSAHARWCLTGTPIQNSVSDLGSLVRFLRVPILSDPTTFRKHITGVKEGKLGCARPNKANLGLLLRSMCLRRSRDILDLPGLTDCTNEPSFTREERQVYNGIMASCKNSIAEAINQDQNARGRSHKPILEALLQLRIFCNVGLGSKYVSDNWLSEPENLLNILQQGGDACCWSCNNEISDLGDGDTSGTRITKCYALICERCFSSVKMLTKRSKTAQKCPVCLKDHDGGIFLHFDRNMTSSEKAEDLNKPSVHKTWPSKLLEVVKDITEHFDTDKRSDPIPL